MVFSNLVVFYSEIFIIKLKSIENKLSTKKGITEAESYHDIIINEQCMMIKKQLDKRN